MSTSAAPVGKIGWTDLTVPDADKVRDFYADVVGWKFSEVDMGGYSDYCMNMPSDGTTTAGVCWQRGTNNGLPPVWLVYIHVADAAESARKVEELGGEIVRPVTAMGPQGRYCVIRDPAGAVCALFESNPGATDGKADA